MRAIGQLNINYRADPWAVVGIADIQHDPVSTGAYAIPQHID